jgi:two-component system chemotaxis sensor kinase CheA
MSSETENGEPILTDAIDDLYTACINEFIDDLYAECDERLGLVRRDILSLESFIDKPAVDKTLLDALLRHYHTLKGLAGTIGLKEAEQLTHHLENYLRAIRQEQISIIPEGISALITGTKALEQSIAAHRTQSPTPDLASVRADLATIFTGTPPPSSAPSPAEKVADENGTRVWRFEFIPTSELAERDINVNAIRARLEKTGNVIEAKPLMVAEGNGLAFEFIVETSADEAQFADWHNDGLTYTLHQTRPPPTSPADEQAPTPTDEPPPSDETAEPLTPSSLAESPPPSDEPAEEPLSAPSLAPSNMVRVDMARLDELMRLIGELVTTRARQENNLKQLQAILPLHWWRTLQETNLAIERQLRDLREGVMRVRLVPIGTAFERMKFVVRDLIGDTQKQVKLELSGAETAIDKFVVDKMMDPLLHLVRNAISHGIEPPQERIARGKPPEGQINLRANTVGDAMMIEIEDDGRGIDVKRITEQARTLGLLDTDATLDGTRLLDMLCQPGFTTQQRADLTSGRGVGMDVVKNTVNELGGFTLLETHIGIGTRFTIQLPLTLAIADALIVTAGGQKFAIPRLSVREVIEIGQTAVTVLENHNEIIYHRGRVLPLVRIVHLFDLKTENNNKSYALIVGGTNGVGIIVDRILGEREIVVRALHDPLVQVPGIAGASELGDGRVILILDVAALTRIAK